MVLRSSIVRWGLVALLFTFSSTSALSETLFALDAPRAQGRHTPYFVALERGFYSEANLELRIVPGRGSADGINRIEKGEVTFAFGDAGALALARAKGVQAKMVAIVYATSPFVIFSVKGTGISNPKDLEGKTVAAPPTDGMRTMFPVFAKVTGIDPDKVRWVDIPIERKDSALIARQVDAMTSGLQQQPLLAKAAAREKIEIDTLRWRDFGFELYSNGLLVSDEVIAAKPELVRAFVRASIRGFTTTFNDIDEAVAIMLKHNPHLDADIVKAEIGIVRDMAMSGDARQNGFG